jgi:hypothetical protein
MVSIIIRTMLFSILEKSLFFVKCKYTKYKDKNAAPKKKNIAKQTVAEVS